MQSPLCLGNSVSALPWKVAGEKTVHPRRRAGLLSVNVELQVGDATGVGQLLWGGRKAFWETLLHPSLGPEAALLLGPFQQSQPYFLPLLKVQWPQNEFTRTSYSSLGLLRTRHIDNFTPGSPKPSCPKNTCCPTCPWEQMILCHPILPH